MTNSEPISVISSYSDDQLFDEAGNHLGAKPGGPALFITDVFKAEKIDFRLFSGEKISVEIKLVGDNEYGRLSTLPQSSDASKLKLGNWTIISTINGEWDIRNIPKLDYLFLDVQGLVRDGESFGQKKAWPQITKLGDKIYGLKGNPEEIACLPPAFVDQQKKKLLVITYGKAGADIYWQNKKYKVTAEKIGKMSDTIGAGDTFFAYLVSGLYHGLTPARAAKYASRSTANFLRNKL